VLRIGIEGEERKNVWFGSLVKGKIERTGLVRETGFRGAGNREVWGCDRGLILCSVFLFLA
jgi:hypothetical protein